MPQFYLRWFADEDEGLYQIEKLVPAHAIPTKVRNVGHQRDYHTLDLDSQLDHSSVEEHLSQIEGQQAKLLKDLDSDPALLSRRRQEFANFVSLMYHRVPGFKKGIETIWAESVAQVANSLFETGQFPKAPPEIEALHQSGQDVFGKSGMVGVKISNWMLISMMLSQSEKSPLVGILRGMYCRVLEACNESDTFITSDTPVVAYCPEHDPSSAMGVGFLHQTIEISLPLSSQKILVFRHQDFEDRCLNATEVRDYNLRMIVGANRFLYVQKPADELLKDVAQLAHQKVGLHVNSHKCNEGRLIQWSSHPVTSSHLK